MGITNLFSLLLVPIALSSGAQKICYSSDTDGSSKVPMPTSIFIDSLPKALMWFPAVDKPGVSCVAACADGRFKYAAVSHKTGDSAPCHCADPPPEQSPPSGTEQSGSYHLVSVPKLSDDTQYAADRPTTVVVHLGSGLIRYIINGEPQPMRFLPAHATGTLRFPADKQGAVGCVGSCWQLGYSAAGMDTTNCVCADLETVKLVDLYRPNSDQIPAVDIKMFLKKPEPSEGANIQITTVPQSHYVRLFFNNVPTGTWFTSSGIPKPPGKWEPIPENSKFPEWKDLPGSEGFDTCVNKCAHKHNPYAALLWVKDGYKCMCGETDVKSPGAHLLKYYPTSPGSWQIVNITAAHKSKPLAPISVTSGDLQMGQISAEELDHGYLKLSLKKQDSSSSLSLQSSYVSSTMVNNAQSGMSWLEQSFPAGGDNRVQCVAECYKLQFNAAAVTSDNKCFCIDDTKKQLKPSTSPPSTGGKVQVIMLPEPPKLAQPPSSSSSSSTITREINVEAKLMSGTVFRLIINGGKVPVQFASAESISKANTVSFTADLFAGQPNPMTCVTRCYRLNFPLVTLVDTKCKCMDSGAVSLTSTSSQGAISVYDISSYITTSKPGEGVSIKMFVSELPESHYMRLIMNNVVSRSWFTAPGVEPAGTWQMMPGALSFGTCVDACAQKFQSYAALLWDEGRNFKCKCGASSGKSEGLTERYPSTPGAWQIMDISAAVMATPLPIMTVSDATGRKAKFSGKIISNGYIKFSMQQSGGESTLQSAYLSALSSGVTWMEYSFSAGSESKVGCVGTCFMLQFSAAAVNSDNKCYCGDISEGQLTPSASPPSTAGMVQVILLPRPSTTPKSGGNEVNVMSWTMTSTVFRLVVNGVPLKPQFAQPDAVSKATASSGVTFPAGSSWHGKPNTVHCAIKCIAMFFPLVTLIGDDCKCMEKGEISLSSSNAGGMVSVYDASASLPKNPDKRTVSHHTIPVTNYVRIMIGDRLTPTKFVAPGSLKGWKKIDKMNSPYNCIVSCMGEHSKYASMIYNPSAYTGQCHCSPRDAEDISFPDKITYPTTGGQLQIVDLTGLLSK